MSGLSAITTTTAGAAVTGTPVTGCTNGAQRRMACRYGASEAVGRSWQHTSCKLSELASLATLAFPAVLVLKRTSTPSRPVGALVVQLGSSSARERASYLGLIGPVGLLGQLSCVDFWALGSRTHHEPPMLNGSRTQPFDMPYEHLPIRDSPRP